MLQATRTVPIVFTQTADPVGAGFVDSLARPGGNATGFTPFRIQHGRKWLELLKEIAPQRDASGASCGMPSLPARDRPIRRRSRRWRQSVGVELRPIDVRDAAEIERAVTAFAAPRMAA